MFVCVCTLSPYSTPQKYQEMEEAPQELQSGLGTGEVSKQTLQTLSTVEALMRLFVKDAAEVSIRYVIGCNREEVTGQDMRNALMYCARTFFDKGDDWLQAKVQEELEFMEEEEEEEEGEEEEEEEEEEEGEEEEGHAERNRALVKHVDTIVENWSKWEPEDEVHQLIKRAIDSTPVSAEAEVP